MGPVVDMPAAGFFFCPFLQENVAEKIFLENLLSTAYIIPPESLGTMTGKWLYRPPRILGRAVIFVLIQFHGQAAAISNCL